MNTRYLEANTVEGIMLNEAINQYEQNGLIDSHVAQYISRDSEFDQYEEIIDEIGLSDVILEDFKIEENDDIFDKEVQTILSSNIIKKDIELIRTKKISSFHYKIS